MKTFVAALAAAVSVVATAASAQTVTVDQNSFADVSGTFAAPGGTVTVATTTDATGRRTTVNGPSGGANRFTAPIVANTWRQSDVGAGATVGITTDYARSGNGSLLFSGTDSGSKADAAYYFGTAIPLATLASASYDAYRDASSTSAAHLINSLRFLIGDAAGNPLNASLNFEPVYNGYPVSSPVPTNTWLTFSIGGGSTIYANNPNLMEPATAQPVGGSCPDCYDTLADWQLANPAATIIGITTGNGSGWAGTYRGAVDNISFTTLAGTTTTFNFEVAQAAAVPEPATWAMMIGGFGMVGSTLRRRRRAAVRFA